MRFLIALDSFKGCLTSAQAGSAIASALREVGHEAHYATMSDGGEGMLQAFAAATPGCQTTQHTVQDPLGRPTLASLAIGSQGTAIVEVAQACGLTLIGPEERNPLTATSHGVGQLVAHALRLGCRNFIVGLGGSGTSDAGIGMLQALAHDLVCTSLAELAKHPLLEQCRFTLACDVRNPLLGPTGAAAVFAPQKGATPDMVELIEARAATFATESAQALGRDLSNEPGAGAAGGLGYAFMQYLRATMQPGADMLMDLLNFRALAESADIVITGEGAADRQTLMGKLPERVLRQARECGKPTWLVAGRVSHAQELMQAGFQRVSAITPADMPIEQAMRPEVAAENLRRWVFKEVRKGLKG